MKSSEKCHYDNGPAEDAVSVDSNANERTNERMDNDDSDGDGAGNRHQKPFLFR